MVDFDQVVDYFYTTLFPDEHFISAEEILKPLRYALNSYSIGLTVLNCSSRGQLKGKPLERELHTNHLLQLCMVVPCIINQQRYREYRIFKNRIASTCFKKFK